MQNHFAETPEELKDQLRESFDCSTNPYFFVTGYAVDNHADQEKIHDLMKKATELFEIAFEWIAQGVDGMDGNTIMDIAEEFHQKVAEEGQFAAVPYDPS